MYDTNIMEVSLMLLIIVINIMVIFLGVLASDILDDKYTKAVKDFCKLECK